MKKAIETSRCICLDIAGMLNHTQKNRPISDCRICDGYGFMKESENLMNSSKEKEGIDK